MKKVIGDFTKLLSTEEKVKLKPLNDELFETLVVIGMLYKIQAGVIPITYCNAKNQDELSESINARLQIISQKTHEFLVLPGNEQLCHLVEPYLNEIDQSLTDSNEQLAKPHKK